MTANTANQSALDAFRSVLTTDYDCSLKGRRSVGLTDATDLPMLWMRMDVLSFGVMDAETFQGAATKACEELGWQPRARLEYLVAGMVREDLQGAERDVFVRSSDSAAMSHRV